MRACSLATTSSTTDSCTSRREPAQQTCPWLKKMPLTMPSTAWSSGASSKTMLAALPPSSRLRRLAVPATLRWISLPTSVEPVKAILSTPSCSTSACPIAGPPAITLTTPGRQVALGDDLGQRERGQRRRLGGLEHDRVAASRAPGAIFQAAISSGKFQGMIWPGDADRPRRGAVARVLELVGPAGVVEEVRRRRAGRRRPATRGSACRCRATRARRARARAPGSRARCGRGTWRARARAGRARPTRRPCRAAATAASTSAAPASATSASGAAVEGSIVATVSPAPARNSPFTKIP